MCVTHTNEKQNKNHSLTHACCLQYIVLWLCGDNVVAVVIGDGVGGGGSGCAVYMFCRPNYYILDKFSWEQKPTNKNKK